MFNNEKTLNKINQISTNKIEPYFNAMGAKLKSVKGVNDIGKFFKYQNKNLLKQLRVIDKVYEKFVRKYNNNEPTMKIIALRLERRLPLFAGYIGNMRFRFHGQHIKSNLVLNIHPISKNETDIFFIAFNKKVSEKNFSKFNDEDLVSVLAEIMACSNNWIINKSYWKLLTVNTRNEILRNRKLIAKP